MEYHISAKNFLAPEFRQYAFIVIRKMESLLAYHDTRVDQQPHNPQRQRSNSSPGTMITHIAADGEASGMVLISHLDNIMADLNAIDCEESSCVSTIEALNGRSRFRTKFVRWATILLALGLVLLGQITMSVTLKRNGIISKDLHDIVSERLLSPVAERVIPELQHRLELFESRMLDTIEMAKLMAPNFNETLFWRDVNATERMVTTQEKLRPGFQHAQKHGANSKHPVVMVPGFVTSGLEVWKGKSCMKNFFRERVWGGLAPSLKILRERSCIMENMALDPSTGGDPKDIKLRSSQGFAAADYFIGNDRMCKYPFTGRKQFLRVILDHSSN